MYACNVYIYICFEFVKDILRLGWATHLGFETITLTLCASNLWELTVARKASTQVARQVGRLAGGGGREKGRGGEVHSTKNTGARGSREKTCIVHLGTYRRHMLGSISDGFPSKGIKMGSRLNKTHGFELSATVSWVMRFVDFSVCIWGNATPQNKSLLGSTPTNVIILCGLGVSRYPVRRLQPTFRLQRG